MTTEVQPRLKTLERLQTAMDVLASMAGRRSYSVCSEVMRRLNCPRRTASSLLARARKELKKQAAHQLADLGSALPVRFAEVFDRAIESKDLRVQARLLTLLAELALQARADAAADDAAPKTPSTIAFITMRRDEVTGEIVPDYDEGKPASECGRAAG